MEKKGKQPCPRLKIPISKQMNIPTTLLFIKKGLLLPYC